MIDPELLRAVMRRWATGIALVTATGQEGPHGMTVSSFTSVSLDPPTILIALERNSRTHRCVQESGAFAVSILAEDQRELADRFAGRAEVNDRFQDVEHRTASTGAPILSSCLAYLDCRVLASQIVASHTVFVGEVIEAGVGAASPPLVYFDREYRRLHDEGSSSTDPG